MPPEDGEESSMLLLPPLPKTPCQKAVMAVFELRLAMVGGITCMRPQSCPFLLCYDPPNCWCGCVKPTMMTINDAPSSISNGGGGGGGFCHYYYLCQQ